MVEVGTFCSECVFFNSGKCDLDLIEKWNSLGNVKSADDSEVVINRICMYRRDKKWNPSVDQANKIELVKQDVHIAGSFIILCKNNDLIGLEKTLLKLKSIKNIDKFKPIIVSDKNSNLSSLVKVAKNIFEKHQVMICLEDNSSNEMLDSVFRKVKNGFIFVLNCSKDFDDKIVEKINYLINSEMIVIPYVKSIDGDVHQMMFVAAVYKAMYGNKESSFDDKITEIYDCLSWDNINEKCSCLYSTI